MKVKFDEIEYVKKGRNGTALKDLCFNIFKKYLNENPNINYEKLKNIFNQWHCNNRKVLLTKNEWLNQTDDGKSRYFKPINHHEMDLYFTTQWGNNGGECDNINKVINFAREEGYDIEILEDTTPKISQSNNDIITNMKIKNIILYGSPGVGKTHNTKKLISLIESGISEKEIFGTIKDNEQNDGIDIDNIKDRVKFITFHQSFGYEDFIEGFRPNEEGNIELEDGVFKAICNESQKNIDNSKDDRDFDFESFLSDFIQEVESKENFTIDTNLTIVAKKKINGDFQSFKVGGRVKDQSLTKDIIQRDFEVYLEGQIKKYQDIKPTYESQSICHGNAPYYFNLYEAMKKYLDNSNHSYESQKSELQNYYLVIDEINRGNISKIFGELITLIEEDKRDTLEVTLPYSKKPFKIPSNLYIIGTMNSTDKSIALIDIALRRRFTFLKMEPKLGLVKNDKAQNIMKQLNEKITDTLGADYVLGHSYFMKIENDDDLDFVLEYKIKPLLEEYFYGDIDGLNSVMKIIEDVNE